MKFPNRFYQYFSLSVNQRLYYLNNQIIKMTQKQSTPHIESSHPEEQNQRQFKCKCAKSYKSYPALYTHIKNKHPDSIDQYKNQSKKPKQGETQKGRPKKHKDRPIQAQEQGQLLNIIELGILDIQQNLRKSTNLQSEGINQSLQILQGNSKVLYQELQSKYDQQKANLIHETQRNYQEYTICDKILDKFRSRRLCEINAQKPIKIYKEQIRFKNELIQHFNCATSVKIIQSLQIIEIEEQLSKTYSSFELIMPDGKTEQLLMNDNNSKVFQEQSQEFVKIIQCMEDVLWKDNQKISKIIRNIYKNWTQKTKQYLSLSPSPRSIAQIDQSASLNN